MNHGLTDTAPTALAANNHGFAFPAADLTDLSEHSSSAIPIDMITLRNRCLGNEVFVFLLLDEFQSSITQQVTDIARLAADANAPAIRNAAHSLKGTASTLAAEELRRSATELEAAAVDNDWKLILQTIARIHQEALRCLDVISRQRPIVARP